jgi:uncharacterized membrane protein YkoI
MGTTCPSQKSDAAQNGGYIRTFWSLLIGLSALTLSACAEEHGRGYWLRHATVTLAQAAQIAEANGPGRAVGAELKQSGTRVFYEIEILDSTNKFRRLRVDAETGKILKGLPLP